MNAEERHLGNIHILFFCYLLGPSYMELHNRRKDAQSNKLPGSSNHSSSVYLVNFLHLLNLVFFFAVNLYQLLKIPRLCVSVRGTSPSLGVIFFRHYFFHIAIIVQLRFAKDQGVLQFFSVVMAQLVTICQKRKLFEVTNYPTVQLLWYNILSFDSLIITYSFFLFLW